MLNKRRRNLPNAAKEGLIPKQCYDDICVRIRVDDETADVKSYDILLDQEEEENEVMELMEKEMWARFSTTGFWRSPSQTDYSTTVSPQLIIDSTVSVSVPVPNNLEVLAS
ncbi:hypothetical protein RIF29_20809 [Crotalaria pallida]|uniref:Uncharacterized protein n=1 Tax=Crotalaria pallida TaxID=3830 RepID=A0AAN9F249_CROPI